MKAPVPPFRALVTGCSSGIGLATARMMRDRGWLVIPTARREEDLDALRDEGFDPLALDLADDASVAGAADTALHRMDGKPGALVNNAGMGQPGAIEDVPREALRHQFEVNVIGMQDLTNRFLPAFRRQGAGRVINVGSMLGRLALPSMGAYAASKFAMAALSSALRVETRGSGVAVSLIEPGPIDTAFGTNARGVARRHLDMETSVFREAYRTKMDDDPALATRVRDPFRKPPESVARVILHAASSPRPRRRYLVTVPAYAGAFMTRFLPESLLEALLWARLSRTYGRPHAGA